MAEPDFLNVSELFGPTVQGEGRHAGQLAAFLRLGGCNLTCWWCDTPYTWDWSRYDKRSEVERWSPQAVARALDRIPGRVVVTGGEPLLQPHGLAQVMDLLPDRVFDVETNGTRPLSATHGRWATVTCSPKVQPSAGQSQQRARDLHPEITQDCDYKIVVADDADVAAVVCWAFESGVDQGRVWLMPEGTDADTLGKRWRWLVEEAVAYGFHASPRLHVLAWGDERGH